MEPISPYRGTFGAPRPPAIDALPLPPGAMPARAGLRPLKAWRYVGVYGPELMVCVGTVRIGPARQAFWAIWDPEARRLYERTKLGRCAVTMGHGRVLVREREAQFELTFDEGPGIETVCPSGLAYAWTRKQAIAVQGRVALNGEP